jgi:prepilin-type processing-associated H-X9-DG protein
MRLPRVRLTVRRLLVVAALAIFAWLAGIIRGQQALAERAPCYNNLRSLSLALLAYQDSYRAFPPGTLPGPLPPEQRISWIPSVYNWTDSFQGVLRFLFRVDLPWYDDENVRPRMEVRGTYEPESEVDPASGPLLFPHIHCPAEKRRGSPAMPPLTSYVGIAGLGVDAATLPAGHPRAGVFGYDRQTRAVDLKDGASMTLLLSETTSGNGPWLAGGPPTVRGLDPGRRPYIGRARQFGGLHRGGVMVVMADGSVRFLGESIDPKVFEALATVAGGEPLPAGWDR